MSKDTKNKHQEPEDTIVPVTTEDGETTDVRDLKPQLEEAQARAAEHWDKLLRATADFENFKKRVAKERSDAARYAAQPMLQSLLTVLDNFEAALAAADQSGDDSLTSLKTGIHMIFQQFKSTLTEFGLEEINARDQVFDPNLHEAVSQQPSPDVPDGHVLQQLRKGYKLHDRLLRPATVIVATAPESEEEADDTAAAPSGGPQSS